MTKNKNVISLPSSPAYWIRNYPVKNAKTNIRTITFNKKVSSVVSLLPSFENSKTMMLYSYDERASLFVDERVQAVRFLAVPEYRMAFLEYVKFSEDRMDSLYAFSVFFKVSRAIDVSGSAFDCFRNYDIVDIGFSRATNEIVFTLIDENGHAAIQKRRKVFFDLLKRRGIFKNAMQENVEFDDYMSFLKHFQLRFLKPFNNDFEKTLKFLYDEAQKRKADLEFQEALESGIFEDDLSENNFISF